jgi:hypothetical protein
MDGKPLSFQEEIMLNAITRDRVAHRENQLNEFWKSLPL